MNGPSWVVPRHPPSNPRRRTATILNLDEDVCAQFGKKMQHDHAQITT